MPELHSFSWEGIQALIETFTVPMMLLFESYESGDWVLNTLNYCSIAILHSCSFYPI